MSNRAARRRGDRQQQRQQTHARQVVRQALDHGRVIPPPPADTEHPAWHFWFQPRHRGGEWVLHDERVIEFIRALDAQERTASTISPDCTCTVDEIAAGGTGQRIHDYSCPAHNTDPTQPTTESTDP